jgi:hypothetical protein
MAIHCKLATNCGVETKAFQSREIRAEIRAFPSDGNNYPGQKTSPKNGILCRAAKVI